MTELTKEAMLVRCAHFYYREKLNIQDVGARLGISRFRVSRYLKEAEDRGIVEIRINDTGLHYETMAVEIEEKYDVKQIVVVPVTSDMESESVRKAVGHKGAEILRGSNHDMTVGITWGRTIAHMVENLSDDQLRAQTICELTGGLGMINAGQPTSALASLFAAKTEAQCFQMSGPIIASDSRIAKAFLDDLSITRTLDMARQSDIAICGIATLTGKSMLSHAGLLSDEDYEALKELGAVGSIIGRFYNASGKEVESDYKDRAIAIAWENFLNIPERIVLAGGWNKLECIKGLLRGGMATTIVLDNITASSLLEDDEWEKL